MYGTDDLFETADSISAVQIGPMPAPSENDVEMAYLFNSLRNVRAELADFRSEHFNTIDAKNATIRSIRSEVDAAKEAHRVDIEDIISPALHDVAERQEWCGEFEQFVSQANRHLTVEILPRTRYYVATVNIEVTIRVNTNGSDNATEEIERIAERIRSRAYYDVSEVTSADVDTDSIDVEVDDDQD